MEVQDIDTIYITGGGFVRRAFRGAGPDSQLAWQEPVWGGELTRSKDFILTNIEDVPHDCVYRCEITYKYMTVQDYIDLKKLSHERVVQVDFFDRDLGERVTCEMAFTGTEVGKIHNFGLNYLGNQNVVIKLVATNREKANLINTTFSVVYHLNGGSGSLSNLTKTWGSAAVLSDGTGVSKTGYSLVYWATKDTGGNYDRYYVPGQHITVWENMHLYAIWEEN